MTNLLQRDTIGLEYPVPTIPTGRVKGKERPLLHPDKDFLQDALRQMRALAENELHMELNEKTHIFPVRQGVDFLGWHFYLTDTGKVVKRLRTQNKRKLKRRMKSLQKGYAEGRLDIEDINRSMAAANGHLVYGHTYKLREKIISETAFVRKPKEDDAI